MLSLLLIMQQELRDGADNEGVHPGNMESILSEHPTLI